MNNPKHESVSEDVERKRKHAERKAANVAADDFLNDPLNLFALSNPRDSFIAGWQARAAAVNPVQDNCHVCEKPMVDIYSAGKKRGCQDVTCKNSFGAAVKPVQNTAPLNGGTCSLDGLRPVGLGHGFAEVGEQNNCNGGVPASMTDLMRAQYKAIGEVNIPTRKTMEVASTGNTEERDQLYETTDAFKAAHPRWYPSSPLSEEKAVEIMTEAYLDAIKAQHEQRCAAIYSVGIKAAYRALLTHLTAQAKPDVGVEQFNAAELNSFIEPIREIASSAWVNGETVSEKQREYMMRKTYTTACRVANFLEWLRDDYKPAIAAIGKPRSCTCHPDDAPKSCQQKFALSACLESASKPQASDEFGDIIRPGTESYQDMVDLISNWGVPYGSATAQPIGDELAREIAFELSVKVKGRLGSTGMRYGQIPNSILVKPHPTAVDDVRDKLLQSEIKMRGYDKNHEIDGYRLQEFRSGYLTGWRQATQDLRAFDKR